MGISRRVRAWVRGTFWFVVPLLAALWMTTPAWAQEDDPPAPVREGLTDQRGQTPPRRGNSGWTRH